VRPEIRLDLGSLRQLYKSGAARPTDIVGEVYQRIAERPGAAWISLVPREKSLLRARKLEQAPLATARPLYGVPFAIQDNIDLAGLPTTAGCPAFAYSPSRSASAVQALIDAGAIPIGKTNMDQFAMGLAGAGSPYGACSSVFDERYVSGGACSGSAVAVAAGMASFALGTDTDGSGRVPAAFNNLVGLKPTRGALSMRGVVPACRTLDCVSIFASTCHDAHTVWMAARGFDPEDSFSRAWGPGDGAAPWAAGSFSFGAPPRGQLEFFGDDEAEELYHQALESLERAGGRRVQIDFSPFRAAGDLLAAGPWAAERFTAIGLFLEEHGEEVHPMVRDLAGAARQNSAADYFLAQHRLSELRRAAESQWESMNVLALPTTGTVYTHEAVASGQAGTDTALGYYTSFVNLLDLAATAVPAGFRANGLPFGISLIAPACGEEGLLLLADRFHRSVATVPGPPLELPETAPGCISVAVVGGHLTGQPLNPQLTERGAQLLRACRTAPGYRLYALDGTMSPKAGLVRDDRFQGKGIDVEVWAIPEDHFGSFVERLPSPLAIGNAALEDGSVVKCIVCEPYAVQGATEITRFGGWKSFLSQPLAAR
jgi:allophanate hydrolase